MKNEKNRTKQTLIITNPLILIETKKRIKKYQNKI